MSKQIWKAGNMLYPLPAVLVSVHDEKHGDNLLTVAWAGTICTNPAMVSISVRPNRYSYDILMNSKEFAINLTCKDLTWATDYCGVTSGRDVDKFLKCDLHKEKAAHIAAPLIKESPVNIECRITETKELGSHTMFIAEVLCVHADEAYMNESGKFCLEASNPIAYSHGTYFELGEELGSFGYSVKKNSSK